MNYLEYLTSLLPAVKSIYQLVLEAQKEARRKKGLRGRLLLEITYNINLISGLHITLGKPAHVVAPKLQTKVLMLVTRSGETVRATKKCAPPRDYYMRHLSAKTPNQLIALAHNKITELQEYCRTRRYQKSLTKGIRFDVRLKTILKILIVLTKHLA